MFNGASVFVELVVVVVAVFGMETDCIGLLLHTDDDTESPLECFEDSSTPVGVKNSIKANKNLAMENSHSNTQFLLHYQMVRNEC